MQGLKHEIMAISRVCRYGCGMRSSARFNPVQAERAHSVVARQIRAAIIDGEYTAGDRLPNEEELAELCRVSRSAVRQALLLLREQGLIEVRSGNRGGTFVAEQSTYEPVVHAIENQLVLGGATLDQLKAAKVVIEPAISATAARQITDGELGRLRANVADNRLAVERGDHDHALRLSLEFHAIVAEATHNPILRYMLTVLLDMAERAPEYHVGDRDRWQRLLDEHIEILTAFEQRDPDKVFELMTNHLQTVDVLFDEG